MKRKKEFVLRFEGLKSGLHEFDFELDKQFFDNIELQEHTHLSEEIQNPHFKVEVQMMKEIQMLILDIKIEGKAEFTCDMCTSDIEMNVNFTDKFIVKFGEENFNETDEIIHLPEGEHELDIEHLLYELVMLNLPARKVCSNQGKLPICNTQVLAKLEEMRTIEEEEKELDPRWEILKNISKN